MAVNQVTIPVKYLLDKVEKAKVQYLKEFVDREVQYKKDLKSFQTNGTATIKKIFAEIIAGKRKLNTKYGYVCVPLKKGEIITEPQKPYNMEPNENKVSFFDGKITLLKAVKETEIAISLNNKDWTQFL